MAHAGLDPEPTQWSQLSCAVSDMLTLLSKEAVIISALSAFPGATCVQHGLILLGLDSEW